MKNSNNNSVLSHWITDKKNLPIIISFLGVLIAFIGVIGAFIQIGFSRQDIKRLDNQFNILNQGYISSKLTFNAVLDSAQLQREFKPSDLNAHITAMNFSLSLTNIGHVPLVFKVKTFDVLLDDKVLNLPMDTSNVSILYPSEPLYVNISASLPLGYNTLVTSFKYYKIYVREVVEYNDYGSSHKKTIDRKMQAVINNNQFIYTNVFIKDQL